MSTQAPVKPQGMLSQDIDKGMNADLANKPVENSTTIMMRPREDKKADTKDVAPKPTNGLLGDMEHEPPKKPDKPPQQSFKELAALRDKAEKQRDEALKELEQARKTSTDAEAFKTKAETLEKELEKASLERSPRYRQMYVDKPKELLGQAKDLAKEFEVPESIIDQAASLDGRSRRDFIDQNFTSPSAVSEITQILHSIDDIFKTRNQELEHHKTSIDKYEKEQQDELAKHGIQSKEVMIQKFEKLLPAVSEKLGSPFTKSGETEHDTSVEENLKMARSLVDGTANEDDVAVAPYLAVAARLYRKQNKSLIDENAKLKARLKQYGDNEPLATHVGGGSESSSSGGKPKGILARANEDFGRR